MRIEQLEHLLYVAEIGSITQAAEYFYMSQQGMSHSIQQLENELKVKILDRQGNRVSLTIAGNLVLQRAKDLIERYRELHEVLQPFQNMNLIPLQAQLTVYLSPFIGCTLLPKILTRINTNSAKLHLSIEEMNNSEVLQRISAPLKNEIIGLVSLPNYYFTDQFRQNFNFVSIYCGNIMILMSAKSSLIKYKALSLSEITQFPIALFNDDPKKDMFIKSLFNNAKKMTNVVLQTTNMDIIRETVRRDVAIGFTTEYTESFFDNSDLVTRLLKGSFKANIGFVCKKDQPFSAAAEEFICTVKDLLDEHLAEKRIVNCEL